MKRARDKWRARPAEVERRMIVGERRQIRGSDLFLTSRLSARSSRGSSQARGGGDSQLHGHKGDVAVPDAGQAKRPDPRLPGPLRARGERRVTGPAPHQGRHAGRCTGTSLAFCCFTTQNALK